MLKKIAITGIGTQILGGIAPTLVALTNGITKVITANMDSIVRFISATVVARRMRTPSSAPPLSNICRKRA